jgi:hypothetical protein
MITKSMLVRGPLIFGEGTKEHGNPSSWKRRWSRTRIEGILR